MLQNERVWQKKNKIDLYRKCWIIFHKRVTSYNECPFLMFIIMHKLSKNVCVFDEIGKFLWRATEEIGRKLKDLFFFYQLRYYSFGDVATIYYIYHNFIMFFFIIMRKIIMSTESCIKKWQLVLQKRLNVNVLV